MTIRKRYFEKYTDEDLVDATYMLAMIQGYGPLHNVKVVHKPNADHYGRHYGVPYGGGHMIDINMGNIPDEETLIYVIAHEVAHMKFTTHCRSHERLTRSMIATVRELLC